MNSGFSKELITLPASLKVSGSWRGDTTEGKTPFFPIWVGLYIFQLMSEGLAPSARGGLSLSDGFPVSICQVRLCTARRSPLLSPGYLLPLSPAGSAAAPGPLPTTARRRGLHQGGISTADTKDTKQALDSRQP